MERQDVRSLKALVDPDYVSVGGPDGRMISAEEFVAEAQRFFSAGSIASWQLDSMVTHTHGDMAICSYAWNETGSHAGQRFELRGIATDVLQRRADGWVHVARHVSQGQV